MERQQQQQQRGSDSNEDGSSSDSNEDGSSSDSGGVGGVSEQPDVGDVAAAGTEATTPEPASALPIAAGAAAASGSVSKRRADSGNEASSLSSGPEPEKRARPSEKPLLPLPPPPPPPGPPCPICYQPIPPYAAARPETCDHVFCFDCLIRWRRASTTCPLDRVPFDAILLWLWPGQPPVRVPAPPLSEQEPQQLGAHALADYFGACAVCGIGVAPWEPDSDGVLMCDHCGVAFHPQCLPLETLIELAGWPANQAWLCEDCRRHHHHAAA